MTAHRPPRIATCLLVRLAPGDGHESLAGDLLEEYQQRRSRMWYWKQVLIAIALQTFRDTRLHPILALRALVLGFGTLSACSWLLTRVALNVLARELPASWWTYYASYPRRVELLAAALTCVATFSSGWIVARLHREHPAGTFLVYFGAFVCYGIVLLATVPQRVPYRPYSYSFASWLAATTLFAACVWAGGFSASGTRSRQTA